MRLRYVLVPIVMLAMLLALACGGDGGDEEQQPTSTPAGTTVTSDDGKLTLSIPNGAMPEGTQVTATATPLEQLPEELQQLRGARTGYLLQPEGLQFSLPVTATLSLERSELAGEAANGMSAYGLVSFSEAAGREVLPVQTTEASLTSGDVTVTAELQHLSYLGLTQGSLRVALQIVGPQIPANSTFTAEAGASVVEESVARLTEPAGVFQASAQVSVDPADEPFIGRDNEEQLNSEQGFSNTGVFHCGDPGPGTYGVAAKATSVVQPEGAEEIRTELNVVLIVDVECVEGVAGPTNTPGPAAPTNTPQPSDGVPEVTVTIRTGCEHTMPGVESEFLVIVIVRLTAGTPFPGVTVDAMAQGPGLINTTASGVTGADGEVLLIFRINRFGAYTVTVQRLTLSDGRLAVVQPGTMLTSSFTVGQTCTPP